MNFYARTLYHMCKHKLSVKHLCMLIVTNMAAVSASEFTCSSITKFKCLLCKT